MKYYDFSCSKFYTILYEHSLGFLDFLNKLSINDWILHYFSSDSQK